MAVIAWDQIGDRTYEAGIDRGVLYVPDGVGVAWNGIVSVSANVKTTVESIYYDGIKVTQVVNVGEFDGKLKAYTYPDEFLAFEGLTEPEDGFYLTGQGPKPFHLSYRSKIGNDVDGLDQGYKIHLLWNLLAIPADKDYETMSLDSSAMEFEWDLFSVPEEVANARPTSYVVIDSRRISSTLLDDLEELLYGTVSTSPELPSLQHILSVYVG